MLLSVLVYISLSLYDSTDTLSRIVRCIRYASLTSLTRDIFLVLHIQSPNSKYVHHYKDILSCSEPTDSPKEY